MMNEDELKSLYRESSTEVPDSRVDDLIMAQAAEALEEKSANADTWRPYLATAASVTLVVALAIQLTPEQQLEIEQTLSPTEPLTMQAPPRPAAKDKSELVESLVANIEAPKPTATVAEAEPIILADPNDAQESISITGSRIRTPDLELLAAQAKIDATRKARMIQSQKLSDDVANESASAEIAALTAPIQTTPKVYDDASMKEELKQILELFEADDIAAAKLRWNKIQTLDLELPENDEIQALWAKLEELLQ